MRNSGMETIFVDLWDGFSDFENLRRVERLAVLLPAKYDYNNDDNNDEISVQEILRPFPGVKHLSLVADAYLDYTVPNISMKRLRRYGRKDLKNLQVFWNIPEINKGKFNVAY